jgi:hypothetical protein
VDADGLDGFEELVGIARRVDALSADVHLGRALRHEVHERHARLVRPARQRQADQDRQHDGIGDEQRDEQRGAAAGSEVLDEQPPHGSVPPLVQEGDEGGFEVVGAAAEVRGRAREEQLPVGQHEHPCA